MVGILVGIDAVILIAGMAVPQSLPHATVVMEQEHPSGINVRMTLVCFTHPSRLFGAVRGFVSLSQEEGKNVQNFVYICTSTGIIAWLSVSFAYKGLLQIIALFMAFSTRKIRILALNDSKEIILIVYLNSIIFSVMVTIEFVFMTYHNIFSALFAGVLWIDATVFLSFVFLPKVTFCLSNYSTTICGFLFCHCTCISLSLFACCFLLASWFQKCECH